MSPWWRQASQHHGPSSSVQSSNPAGKSLGAPTMWYWKLMLGCSATVVSQSFPQSLLLTARNLVMKVWRLQNLKWVLLTMQSKSWFGLQQNVPGNRKVESQGWWNPHELRCSTSPSHLVPHLISQSVHSRSNTPHVHHPQASTWGQIRGQP